MCDPVTATALAMSGGGQLMDSMESNSNAKRVQNAKNQAYETAMARQRQYANEAGTAFGDNVQKQGSEAFGQQSTKEADRMKQAFAAVRSADPDYSAVPSSTPKNVVIASQAANAKADAKTDRDVSGMSTLTGYNNALFNQGLDRNQFARLFGNLQDKATHDSALIPLDMQAAANNAQKAKSLFPMLLKAGGTALAMYNVANPGEIGGMFGSPSSAENFGSTITGPGTGGLY